MLMYFMLRLGMLENFSTLITTYGMIPNGNRVYYIKRSQPPLFIPMVEEYYKVEKSPAISFIHYLRL